LFWRKGAYNHILETEEIHNKHQGKPKFMMVHDTLNIY
jgi:hypothetical protein